MGFRFRKSMKVAPGVRVNFSKSGPSVSLGGKYGRTTINPGRGTVTNSARTGIPGLSYSETHKVGGSGHKSSAGGGSGGSVGTGCLKWFLILCFWPIVLPIWFYRSDIFSISKKARLGIIAAVFAGFILLGSILPEPVNDPDPTPAPTAVATVAPTPEPTEAPTPEPTEAPTPEPTQAPTAEPAAAVEEKQEMVWISDTGKRYHSNSSCSNMKNPRQVTLKEAEAMHLTPCKKCH